MIIGKEGFRRGGRLCRGLGVLACGLVLLSAGPAFGQATNQITAVNPDAAAQGTAGLVVTFTLDTDAPPAPPAGVLPDSVTIGSLSGTSVTHPSQYILTAAFDIPAGELAGPKDAAITFSPPTGGTLVFSKADAFTVTPGGDTPPVIVQQPESQTVPPGGVATFTVMAYGSEPLSYQWYKDGEDIAAATAAAYTIDPVADADAGAYWCVVTNDFGTATSDEAVLTVSDPPAAGYRVVDTGQSACYDDLDEITCPGDGEAFSGQDAQHTGNPPSYALGCGGLCVIDNVTGLVWQRSPDTDGDGDIDIDDKLTWPQAQAYPAALNAEGFGGHSDWRLPTIKELYSLIDFDGLDPSGCDTEASCPGLRPFIDTGYFDFAYGDVDAGERVIDSQYASSTLYVSTVDGELLFGVNFADGRIKGYGLSIFGQDKTFLVMCVRDNTEYGLNDFVDNGDGTITDRGTGLTWQQADSGYGMFWGDALDYARNLTLAGHDDWRLPDAKELQSILDYTRSPDTTSSAAIHPLLEVTAIINEQGAVDYPYYWAGTTHVRYPDHGDPGVYLAFGRGLGYMDGQWRDVHGAGCQRSDPKFGDPDDYPYGHGPQGDAVRIYNHVRCVRGCSGQPGDFNCDGAVDLADHAAFAGALAGPGVTTPPDGCPADTFVKADLDGDGDVDLADAREFVTLLTP